MVRRMRFACWIIKATDTHFVYVIRIEFAEQFCEPASDFAYNYFSCLYTLFGMYCSDNRLIQYDVSKDLLHLYSE
jgi:hypothetical protein